MINYNMYTFVKQQSNQSTITKKDIYKQLAELYFLPQVNAKGVNRKYLQAVRDGTVYRVNLIDLKRFMSELTPSQLKKSTYTQRYEAYRKLSVLLSETNEKPLGFDHGIIPDGAWLYPVARFIDRCNVCCLFEVSIEDVGESRADSHKVMVAKRSAEKFLLIDSGLMKIETVKKQATVLTESHKRLRSRECELQNLKIYTDSLMTQIEQGRKKIENELMTAVLIVCMEGEKKTVEEVFKGKDFEQQKEVINMLRFI